MKKPIIKFNGGNPVNICEDCRTIVAYVHYNEENDKYINPDGSEPQTHCDSCNTKKEKKKAIKKAKAIVDSCETTEQLEIANSYLNNFLNVYQDEKAYDKLLNQQKEKYKSLKEQE